MRAKVKNLKSIEEVNFEDISSKEEIDHYERVEGSELREETSDLGATITTLWSLGLPFVLTSCLIGSRVVGS